MTDDPDYKLKVRTPIRLKEAANLLQRLADQYQDAGSVLGGRAVDRWFVSAEDGHIVLRKKPVYES